MLQFSRMVFQLKDNPAYVSALADVLPPAARIATAWPSVLMGFDFHLTADGPKLIEINNNAGGLYIGDDRWLPQPDIAELNGALEQRLAAMFHADWSTIAIMDDDVTGQFMYPEMQAYASLLGMSGRRVMVVSPDELQLRDDGLYGIDANRAAVRIDAVYNRHTDFYLESADVAHIRKAYERGQVMLNPHPRSYALIGDKTRMVDWWRDGLLESCIDQPSVACMRAITPQTRRMLDVDAAEAWTGRKQWVFKPAARHGGKGVLLGKSMSRKRFDALDVNDTIMQQLVPPSEVDVEGNPMKLDIRLYMHGDRLIALAGRVWRGQVTNFRQAGSGWVALRVDG